MNMHIEAPSNALPTIPDLLDMLSKKPLAQVAYDIGSNRKAITARLRRHGINISLKQTHRAAPRRAPIVMMALPKKEYADRVTRTTISGAQVTMPRVAFIDGVAE